MCLILVCSLLPRCRAAQGPETCPQAVFLDLTIISLQDHVRGLRVLQEPGCLLEDFWLVACPFRLKFVKTCLLHHLRPHHAPHKKNHQLIFFLLTKTSTNCSLPEVKTFLQMFAVTMLLPLGILTKSRKIQLNTSQIKKR